jgi:hypothetical protein
MSKNNTIKKSDKKYIRTQKSLIRAQFSDAKKQKEMIDALYARLLKKEVAATPAAQKAEVKKVVSKKSKVKK